MTTATNTTTPEGILRYNGTLTVESTSGKHRTFRIRSIRNGKLTGKRVLEVLTGPANTEDFTPFAFVDRIPDPRGGTRYCIKVWSKMGGGFFVTPRDAWKAADKGTDWQILAATVLDLHAGPKERGRLERMGFRVHMATCCRRCNRALTVPASIESGIGPECSAKEGLPRG